MTTADDRSLPPGARADSTHPAAPGTPRHELLALARLFFWLGCTAFGGPAAHIALMREEVVRRRRWLTDDEFLDLVGASNLIPGPSSTELAIHIGHRRAGWPGLIVAGLGFILPATFIVFAIAVGYVRFGRLPEVAALLYGIKPVMVAIVLDALWGLGRTAIKNRWLLALAALALVGLTAGAHELAVLFAAGILAGALRAGRKDSGAVAVVVSVPVGEPGLGAATGGAATTLVGGLLAPKLFWLFAKIGSVLFGSGYVLLAFLRAELVDRRGWLTEAQLLDAIAVGQITPGPVFTTATFIGYVVAGGHGAIAATAGIFLPAFVFVALSGPLIPRLRRSPVAGAFLDGVNVASLALMTVVTFQLGRAALVDVTTVIVAVVGFGLLRWRRVNTAYFVVGASLIGLVARGIGP